MDVRTGKTERECKLGTAEVQDLEISKDGGIVTVAAAKSVHFLDARQFSVVKKHDLGINVEAATLHPSGKRFVAGGSDLWVHVIDFETGTELECHKGHHGPVFCLRYAPDGESYASGSEDGTIRIWRTNPNNLEPAAAAAAGGATAKSDDVVTNADGQVAEE
jgi:serine-threonine kinase receptor-associated protein